MILKQILISISGILLFTSCETSEVITKTKQHIELNNIGIALLNKKSSKIDNIFPKLDSTFNSASLKYGKRFLAKQAIALNQKFSCQFPDSMDVKNLCEKNNLDAIVLSHIEFKKIITDLVPGVPIEKFYECTIYTKILDKNGNMLYSIVHDSKNDEYETIPSTYDVVSIATGMSYKKINKLMRKTN